MAILFDPVERPEASKRRDPNLKDKLASALLELAWLRGDPVPIEHAQQMSAEQICSLFEWDHAHRVNDGGSNHPLNITPRFPGDHGKKTAKFDVPQIRKGQRLAATHDEHRAKMQAKLLAPTEPTDDRRKGKRQWQSRKWPEGRKLESRNTLSRKPKSRL